MTNEQCYIQLQPDDLGIGRDMELMFGDGANRALWRDRYAARTT
jgi:hypothetical protein